VDGLSLDYASLGRAASRRPAALGAALLAAVGERYENQNRCHALHVFAQHEANFLFDLANAADCAQEDRTVAAWTLTPARVAPRDLSYQRGYPLPDRPELPLLDRGHLIPHLSGGEFGPNIFAQDRALNRGWSEQGKRYRAMERESTRTGAFFFGHLLYVDDTAWPTAIEIAVLRGEELCVDRFDNRPNR
jgi:hypothetical protein